MRGLGELVRRYADLSAADIDWLHRLVAEWQLLADLSFADLVLWVPVADADEFVAVAQMRPTTGPTVHRSDLVGETVSARDHPQFVTAVRERRVVREGDPVWAAGVPRREETIPVCRERRCLALVARDTNLTSARTPSQLEVAYLQSANDLATMVAEGRFPFRDAPVGDDLGPRVGDGFIRLDATGTVVFASPNALSAYRRLGFPGDLVGRDLAEVTAQLATAQGPVDEPVAIVATGRVPRTGDVETPHAAVSLRAIPLSPGGRHIGAVVLVHDVTELRRRDRQLLSKDATIREIHHRVKNNLQTVAALLRLQARRVAVPEARTALQESVRRVSSIAMVHETLSLGLEQAVAFDDIADRVVEMVADVTLGEHAVRMSRTGSFGVLPAEVATPLALVLTELVQNAVEHAFGGGPGEVVVRARRDADRLRVEVVDNGAGLPAGFDPAASDRLGLQIVRALVEGEMNGALAIGPADSGGTGAVVDVPLPHDRTP